MNGRAWPPCALVGSTLPNHVDYGIDRINQEVKEWLRGKAERPPVLAGEESPHWTRLYSRQPDSLACDVLGQVLERMEAKRMVMGHTVQREGISSACGGLAWRIDVGMATYYGGRVEVLEIVGDSVRVLQAAPKEDGFPVRSDKPVREGPYAGPILSSSRR